MLSQLPVFNDLFISDTVKMEVIVTFIAVLELVKRGRVEFLQTTVNGEIWIQRPSRPPEDETEPKELETEN